MKIIFIILFLISILILTSKIEICIKNLEITNKKIKFLIRVKIYIFNHILILNKKIRKKDIIKLIEFSEKKNIIKKEEKIIKKIPIKLSKLDLKLDYGIKHIYSNIYIYAFLNSIIPMVIYKYSSKRSKIKYKILNDFNTNYIHVQLSSKIQITIIQTLKNYILQKIKSKTS